MDALDDKVLDDFLAPATVCDMTPEHRAWINDQVRQRLAGIEAGKTKFRSLEEVRRKFGFDAY